jgi:hypothetical protein
MIGICDTHGKCEKCIYNYCWKNLNVRKTHLEDLGIDGKIIEFIVKK